jgi:hypothetical protein
MRHGERPNKSPNYAKMLGLCVYADVGFFLYQPKEYVMRNVFKQIGVIALVAIIGFSFAALSLTGCGGGGDGDGDGDKTVLSGTSWSHYDNSHGATEVLSFSSTGNSVTLKDPWINLSGTYTVTGSNVTIQFTSPFQIKYTGVISDTILTITTDRNETQIFQKQ